MTFKTLKLQWFSYFLHLPDLPRFSAFMYSVGRFSSIDDEGLEKNCLSESEILNISTKSINSRKNDVKNMPNDTVVIQKRKSRRVADCQQQTLLAGNSASENILK